MSNKGMFLIFCVVMLLVLMVITVGYLLEIEAKGAGTTTVNITTPSTAVCGGVRHDTDGLWSQMTLGEGEVEINGSAGCTFQTDGVEPYYETMIRGFIGFPVSSINATSDTVIRMSVFVYGNGSYSGGAPADWGLSHISFFKMTQDDNEMDLDDYRDSQYAGSVMVTEPKLIDDTLGANAWHEFELYEGYLDEVLDWQDDNGYLWFCLDFLRQQLNVAPTWMAGGFKQCSFSWTWAASFYPYLQVEYVEGVTERRTYADENDEIDVLCDGTERADNITWASPRCAFADDIGGIRVKVNGDSGANVTLRAVDNFGVLLASHQDSVRVDGCYNWSFEVANSYEGYIRIYEDVAGIYSTWGRVEKAPSPSMLNLQTYVRYTDWPQYDYEFKDYVVYEDDVLTVYWATNMEDTEFDDYDLRLLLYGQESGIWWTENITDLNDEYFQTVKEENDYLACFRYAKFFPDVVSSGVENYDGLIMNLNQSYYYGNSGFVVPLIVANSDNVPITDCHSAFWYLRNWAIDGLDVVYPSSVMDNTEVEVNVYVGAYSGVQSYLSNCTVKVIGSDGVVNVEKEVVLLAGDNYFTFVAPEYRDIYEIRFVFYDDTVNPYFEYVCDKDFIVSTGLIKEGTVGTGGAGDTTTGDPVQSAKNIVNNITVWMKQVGMWNTGGKMAVIILVALLVLIMCWVADTPSFVKLILPSCVFGVGLLWNWIDSWWIVLLAMAASSAVWGIVSHIVAGSTGGKR